MRRIKRYLLQLGFGAIASLGAAWALSVGPRELEAAPLRLAVTQILDEVSFKTEVLAQNLPHIERLEKGATCQDDTWRISASLRLELLERTLAAGDLDAADGMLPAVTDRIRRLLSCSPEEPLFWLALLWADTARYGFHPERHRYLDMSYAYGPFEGWIIMKRFPITIAIKARLPSSLQRAAIDEFATFGRSEGYDEQAAELFFGVDEPTREAIVPRLATGPALTRWRFAKRVYSLGLDVKVPGVELREPRPWD